MPTTARSVLFRAGAILLPVVVLVVAEGVMRFAGVAADATDPFRPVRGHEDHLLLSAEYTGRYFGSFTPGVAFTPFRAKKADDTFRVFAFGGSTTAGFPYDGYAFPFLVQSRLESFLPGLRNEVVNLALTATNSYTVWDLSRDVAALDPDAVIIYAGHNEYYGAFGAGTSINRLGNVRWLKRLVIRLKRSVIYTLLEEAFSVLRPTRDIVGRTMMAEAVGSASIPLDGATFREGVVQFEENLGAVVRRFCDSGVPVYVGTLTSNLADQPPLGESAAARSAYEAGLNNERTGNLQEARAHFEEARDLDDLRFRAPSEMNRVIKRVVGHSCGAVVDLDEAFRSASPNGMEGDELFVDHLHPDVGGHDLMAEAFFAALLGHPRLRDLPRLEEEPVTPDVDPLSAATADFRIARLKLGHPFSRGYTPEEEADRVRTFVRDFVRRSVIDSLGARLALGDLSEATAAFEVIEHAGSHADTAAVLLMYRSLLRRRPFDDDHAREAIMAGVGGSRPDPLVKDLARMWVNRSADDIFLQALVAVALEFDHLEDAHMLLAASRDGEEGSPAGRHNRIRLLMARGDTAAALASLARLASDLAVATDESRWSVDLPFHRVLGLESDDFGSLVWLGDNYRRSGELQDAIDVYESALRRRPGDLPLQNNIATVYLQLGDTTEAAARYRAILDTDSTFVEAWLNLALYYARTGRVQKANEAMRRAVQLAPDHPMVQRLLGGSRQAPQAG